MFPDDAAAEEWFVRRRWPDGVHCPHCGSVNVQTGAKHKTMPYRCREKECARRFSAKAGTVMEGSKLGFQVWMLATYLLSTSLKSVSSMKLHRDLQINQRSAWSSRTGCGPRWRKRAARSPARSRWDETYMGGKRKNMPKAKRRTLEGRGAAGKTAVIGAKDRATNKVSAAVVQETDAETLQDFVADHAAPDATVYTDDATAYRGIPYDHETVKHSVGEYVGRNGAHQRH